MRGIAGIRSADSLLLRCLASDLNHIYGVSMQYPRRMYWARVCEAAYYAIHISNFSDDSARLEWVRRITFDLRVVSNPLGLFWLALALTRDPQEMRKKHAVKDDGSDWEDTDPRSDTTRDGSDASGWECY